MQAVFIMGEHNLALVLDVFEFNCIVHGADVSLPLTQTFSPFVEN